ncbi:2TM domain-containing protein [Chishuiella sp.]|uniref:2TM domain-containing protein n=1 Tax=Chishuiella sp. TaxID=1969467 RepID=UPI0028A5E97F|nr:2TM domain-containing protein [Chishuiella sp.]
MKTQLSQEEKIYILTFERSKELKKYYTSLCIYITFSLFFFILNCITYKGKWWFHWPMLIWGLIVILHTIMVFVFNKDWEKSRADDIYIIDSKINQENEYYIALKRVKELKNYYTNLIAYPIFILFLFILNYKTSYGHWWFYWPMLGWGFAIVLHTMRVFALGKEWEERKAQQIVEKYNQRTKKWD